nr:MAG TPA: hypothetical protein [Caudoviricetes sp.]
MSNSVHLRVCAVFIPLTRGRILLALLILQKGV